jgi:hypothetical protein
LIVISPVLFAFGKHVFATVLPRRPVRSSRALTAGRSRLALDGPLSAI